VAPAAGSGSARGALQITARSLGRVLDLFGMDLGIVERWTGAGQQNVSSLR